MLHRRIRQVVDQRGGVARFRECSAPFAAAVVVVIIVVVVVVAGTSAVRAVVTSSRTDGYQTSVAVLWIRSSREARTRRCPEVVC